MQTLIKYKMLNGGDGEALIAGVVSNVTQAKHELAHAKSLPSVNAANASADEIDDRLRQSGIDQNSLTLVSISE